MNELQRQQMMIKLVREEASAVARATVLKADKASLAQVNQMIATQAMQVLKLTEHADAASFDFDTLMGKLTLTLEHLVEDVYPLLAPESAGPLRNQLQSRIATHMQLRHEEHRIRSLPRKVLTKTDEDIPLVFYAADESKEATTVHLFPVAPYLEHLSSETFIEKDKGDAIRAAAKRVKVEIEKLEEEASKINNTERSRGDA